MAYSILLRPAAIRDLKSLPSGVRSRIETGIGRLVDDPRTSGTRKPVGFDDEWRLRVGDYRVLYVILYGSYDALEAERKPHTPIDSQNAGRTAGRDSEVWRAKPRRRATSISWSSSKTQASIPIWTCWSFWRNCSAIRWTWCS